MFRDRQDAGRKLAERLAMYAGGPQRGQGTVVLGIPRGGVIVAREVADALGWPLDAAIVRKLGVPGHEELAFGAVAPTGPPVLDHDIVRGFRLSDTTVRKLTEAARAEALRREQVYRQGRPPLDIAGKRVILVDDGIATGADMRAAGRLLREHRLQRLIVAVPVAPPGACQAARYDADEMVCLVTPDDYIGVGQVYREFGQVSDDAVIRALTQSPHAREVRIPADSVELEADLALPGEPRGLVLFAHGSGSSRHSPRNRRVAAQLQASGLGTLLLDLLSHEEETRDRETAELRFDIALLAARLRHATNWAARQPELARLDFGYFGASTGAAAALAAAAGEPRVTAIVSRGGRPDLAGAALASTQAATLLIVGGRDTDVLAMNRDALARCAAPVKQLAVVPGATHLFEEPDALDEVARLASAWFTEHLRAHAHAA